MVGYEYVSMDSAGKVYFPTVTRKALKNKKFLVLTMPNGDIILHPIRKFKDPLKALRDAFGPVKGDLKKIKKEILETAMEGV